MIPDADPVLQAFLGTIMTWGLTAAGAAVAFVVSGNQRKLLDGSLGFAAGVMLAASYWSLLAPAIEMAQDSGIYGSEGQFAFAPVAAGFFLGAGFVFAADLLMTYAGIHSPLDLEPSIGQTKHLDTSTTTSFAVSIKSDAVLISSHTYGYPVSEGPLNTIVRQRQKKSLTRGRRDKREPPCLDGRVTEDRVPSATVDAISSCDVETEETADDENNHPVTKLENNARWKRILLLIIAITVHNIPEGLAVGVAFGSVGKSASATYQNAWNLAVGIGIQNFPEGLAVSLPLKLAGFSALKSVWYGQLSGIVEPLAGVLGALLVSFIEPILPYSLAFAAGAMIYVVIDDIIPEAQTCGNGKLASCGAIIGFLIMMSLDLL